MARTIGHFIPRVSVSKVLGRLGPVLLLTGIHSITVQAQEQAAGPLSPAVLRNTAFTALEHCVAERTQESCAAAEQALQALIGSAQTSQQRLHRPRCLSGLTRVETSLHTFRWGLSTTGVLKTMVDSAALDCPTASAPISQ